MKLRDKIFISVAVGLIAMLLYSTPAWWGVLFSPISDHLVTAQSTAGPGWFSWELDGIELRLKSLDALFALFH